MCCTILTLPSNCSSRFLLFHVMLFFQLFPIYNLHFTHWRFWIRNIVIAYIYIWYFIIACVIFNYKFTRNNIIEDLFCCGGPLEWTSIFKKKIVALWAMIFSNQYGWFELADLRAAYEALAYVGWPTAQGSRRLLWCKARWYYLIWSSSLWTHAKELVSCEGYRNRFTSQELIPCERYGNRW